MGSSGQGGEGFREGYHHMEAHLLQQPRATGKPPNRPDRFQNLDPHYSTSASAPHVCLHFKVLMWKIWIFIYNTSLQQLQIMQKMLHSVYVCLPFGAEQVVSGGLHTAAGCGLKSRCEVADTCQQIQFIYYEE